MTHHITAGRARRPRIAHLVRAAARKLSDRLYADADDRARALGWTVTETPGWLGLSGRSYRDPRFAARRQDRQNASVGRDDCHELPAARTTTWGFKEGHSDA
jgi:hypothetical protein